MRRVLVEWLVYGCCVLGVYLGIVVGETMQADAITLLCWLVLGLGCIALVYVMRRISRIYIVYAVMVYLMSWLSMGNRIYADYSWAGTMLHVARTLVLVAWFGTFIVRDVFRGSGNRRDRL